MQTYRLRDVPRLARVLIGRLLDCRAAVRTGRQSFSVAGARVSVDRVTWYRRTVRVRGQNSAGTLSFTCAEGSERTVPEGEFDIGLPRRGPERPIRIGPSDERDRPSLRLAGPARWREALARVLAVPKALGDIAVEAPALLALVRSGDPAISAGIQDRLGLSRTTPVPLLPAALFGPTPLVVPNAVPAIVLPVFDGFDMVDALLERLDASCETPHHLILIDDGSRDPRIAPRLLARAAAHPETTTIIRNNRNMGFVHAANSGIETARGMTKGHIVLLNSDTQVPDGWLLRLLRPILLDAKVASVTPMSNAAEILTVPSKEETSPLSLEAVAQIDRAAARLSGASVTVECPTGVGFCMALNRTFVERIGGFDPAFGKGYGEEVDWCQKARRLGGRHVCAANLFVGHQGAASFGASARDSLRRTSDALINARYPGFAADVRDWCHDDPLGEARLVLSLAWLAQTSAEPVPVFLAHGLGGGAEAALGVEIDGAFAADAKGVVVLRVGGPRMWRIEVITAATHQRGDVHDDAQLAQLMGLIPLIRLVYSCGAGSADPIRVPRLLRSLAERAVSLDIRMHDYLPISPSWTLLDEDGRFRDVPPRDTTDIAHRPPGGHSHADWRALWESVIDNAREVTVFSQSSAAIVHRAFPGAGSRVTLRPHRLIAAPTPLPPGGRNIGILGSINRAKGAEVLHRLAGHSGTRRLVVIGEMDGRMILPRPHIVHGRFEPGEIDRLARRYGIGVWLIPSVWPETFSFTTHEALATGLPVLVFDLGGQAEAAHRAANGHVLNAEPEDTAALAARIEALFSLQADDRLRAAS